ncbi:hypothetical protein P280DRAFT_421072 [Massarina eburnea CBS 473.64]|uniref:SnoaL-like domain-containing protein n=1 Tax=Massarina eburnea CBS 473.64 TaxID=1395130 RepID=A0A6A6SBQ0_9PLEO|nr:hypothetical protein P280DRAFT_421072 [Massarina eburnea CBS 473.64]
MSTITPNAHDALAIQNTISRYCEALDTKTFDLLDKVFVRDVVASYPFNAEMTGVEAVKRAIEKRLGPILTHHSLTTQTIQFPCTPHSADARTASAVTYFVGVHFGQGPHEGKLLQAWGKYVDELVCLGEDGDGEDRDRDGVAGASGLWRIGKRTVGFTKRIGDEAIMKDF